jgi:hypothetical protein
LVSIPETVKRTINAEVHEEVLFEGGLFAFVKFLDEDALTFVYAALREVAEYFLLVFNRLLGAFCIFLLHHGVAIDFSFILKLEF